MLRVTRPGGTVGIAVWAGLEQSPGYRLLADIAERGTTPETAAVLRSPFVLHDRDELVALVAGAGWAQPSLETEVGTIRFNSVGEFIRAEIEGSPLADTLGPDGYAALVEEAKTGLAPFCTTDGLQFPISAHLVTSRLAP